MDSENTTIHDLLFQLYERNSQTFTKEELEWLACAIEQAEVVATSLRYSLANAAFLLEQQPMASVAHDMPDLISSATHQLDAIRGLLHVGSSAAYRLRHPEKFEKKESKPTADIEQLRKQV